MRHGMFITFEGPDGSGKTTVSTAVEQRLREEGYDTIYTREPGGSDIAEQIRRVILDPENTAMDARTEALLYAASRRQHLVEVILPALAAGKNVISDRFVDSSLAYQGCGRGLGVDEVLAVNQFAIEGHMPDRTIYLKISAREGLKRIQSREYLDRLDQEKTDFHETVAAGYESLLERFRDRMIVIPADQPKEKVIAEAYLAVKKLLDE
jgi:dTMP kinase